MRKLPILRFVVCVLLLRFPVAEMDDTTELRRLEGHTGIVCMAVFSRDGETLASASEDGTARLWNWRTGTTLKTLRGHTSGVIHVAYSPDGKTLATSSRDNTVILWDPATGEKRATLDDHTGAVNAALFSPDGKTLTTASDDTLVIVRAADRGAPAETRRPPAAGDRPGLLTRW